MKRFLLLILYLSGCTRVPVIPYPKETSDYQNWLNAAWNLQIFHKILFNQTRPESIECRNLPNSSPNLSREMWIIKNKNGAEIAYEMMKIRGGIVIIHRKFSTNNSAVTVNIRIFNSTNTPLQNTPFEVINQAGPASRKWITNQTGYGRLQLLQPGTYEIGIPLLESPSCPGCGYFPSTYTKQELAPGDILEVGFFLSERHRSSHCPPIPLRS